MMFSGSTASPFGPIRQPNIDIMHVLFMPLALCPCHIIHQEFFGEKKYRNLAERFRTKKDVSVRSEHHPQPRTQSGNIEASVRGFEESESLTVASCYQGWSWVTLSVIILSSLFVLRYSNRIASSKHCPLIHHLI